MKIIALKAVPLVLPAALLVWAYSPKTYFRHFNLPFSVTLASYVIVYLLVVVVSVVLAPQVARRVGRGVIVRAFVQAIVAAFIFAALAVVFGPIGFDVPGTRVRGIFFAEWKFMNFFFYVGLLVALTSAATALLRDDEQLDQVQPL